jgi:predicted nucleic acid-binding protein
VAREISQRELRNDSGEIMRQLDAGESFVVTRNGVPVGELRPFRRRHCSALTLAELTAAPGMTTDPAERARRQELVQRVEATFNPLPFDVAAARAYGRVASAVTAAGRTARGARAVDLLIAATALAHGLPLVTRNASDLVGLGDLLEVVESESLVGRAVTPGGYRALATHRPIPVLQQARRKDRDARPARGGRRLRRHRARRDRPLQLRRGHGLRTRPTGVRTPAIGRGLRRA